MTSEATILLADDEETFAKATQTLLQGEGYDCHTVKDSKELSQALHPGNIYDLLITDLNMPGNHVMEMVDEIQDHSKVLPVIVVTGYPSLATAVDSVRLNVIEYIVKPVEYPDLLMSIRKGLEFKQQIDRARKERDDVSQRVDQLEGIEEALLRLGGSEQDLNPDRTSSSSTIVDLQAQLHAIVAALEKARSSPSSFNSPEAQDSQPSLSVDYLQLREGIHDAIQVLQHTKGSFKSKELAGLRLMLQDLLKKTRPQL